MEERETHEQHTNPGREDEVVPATAEIGGEVPQVQASVVDSTVAAAAPPPVATEPDRPAVAPSSEAPDAGDCTPTEAETHHPREDQATQPPSVSREMTREEILERLMNGREKLTRELKKVIIGQEKVIEELMIVLFAGGHCLLSGAPGLAKTLLIRTLANILDLNFKRIQFTPDLMPSDITGTEILDEDRATGHRELRFIKGPIFTNVLLADEINRTPPKTQAALLEAMEEKQVSAAGETYALDRPFYVFATQNPIELEGTYPLPEAQMDRFMFKIMVGYLNEDDELAVATQTTSGESDPVSAVFTGEEMIRFAGLVRQVPIASPIARYAVRIAQASRPAAAGAPDFVRKWVSWGAGTRASQYLILGAKARALLQGRYHVSCADIRAVTMPALRHRILTNFQADADRVDTETIISRLLEHVPEPQSGLT